MEFVVSRFVIAILAAVMPLMQLLVLVRQLLNGRLERILLQKEIQKNDSQEDNKEKEETLHTKKGEPSEQTISS